MKFVMFPDAAVFIPTRMNLACVRCTFWDTGFPIAEAIAAGYVRKADMPPQGFMWVGESSELNIGIAEVRADWYKRFLRSRQPVQMYRYGGIDSKVYLIPLTRRRIECVIEDQGLATNPVAIKYIDFLWYLV